MKVTGNVFVIGKVERPWKDSSGTERISYSVNISQSNGQIIDTIRLSAEQYNNVEPNRTYAITAEYGVSKQNGGYLRLTDIVPAK